MKNFFKAVSFLALLCFLLFGVGLIFIPKNNTKAAGISNVSANGILAERDDSLDIVFIGNSETYNTFIPMYMYEDHGFTSYICGTGGQFVYEAENFLKRTFESQSPKLIVMEADMLFKKSKMQGVCELMLGKVLPVFKYHDRWKSLKADDFTKLPEYNTANPQKGYYVATECKPPKFKADYMKENSYTTEIIDLNLQYFERIVELCRKNNAELIIVSAPSHRNWSYDRHDVISALADKYSLVYRDYNCYWQELGIDWNHDTKDGGDHLNYYGAVKVTADFGKWLDDNYDLPDHRQDDEYSDWNEGIAVFKDIIDKKINRAKKE